MLDAVRELLTLTYHCLPITVTPPGDGADARAHQRGLTLVQPLDDHPREERARRGDLRVDSAERGNSVRVERRSGVEPEPPEPQHARAERDKGDVVRVGVQLSL